MSVCSKILLFFIIFWSWVLSKIIQKKFIYKHQFCVFCSTLCLSSWLLYPTTTMRLLREEVVVTNISICLLTPNTCTHKKNFFFGKIFHIELCIFFVIITTMLWNRSITSLWLTLLLAQLIIFLPTPTHSKKVKNWKLI